MYIILADKATHKGQRVNWGGFSTGERDGGAEQHSGHRHVLR